MDQDMLQRGDSQKGMEGKDLLPPQEKASREVRHGSGHVAERRQSEGYGRERPASSSGEGQSRGSTWIRTCCREETVRRVWKGKTCFLLRRRPVERFDMDQDMLQRGDSQKGMEGKDLLPPQEKA